MFPARPRAAVSVRPWGTIESISFFVVPKHFTVGRGRSPSLPPVEGFEALVAREFVSELVAMEYPVRIVVGARLVLG